MHRETTFVKITTKYQLTWLMHANKKGIPVSFLVAEWETFCLAIKSLKHCTVSFLFRTEVLIMFIIFDRHCTSVF